MTYEEIHTSVETLVKKYEERDPFKLCRAMGIVLLLKTVFVMLHSVFQ